MNGAEATFYVVAIGASVGGTVWLYPSVRKHAQSAKNSLLAAAMASLLAGTALALVAASVVNALLSLAG